LANLDRQLKAAQPAAAEAGKLRGEIDRLSRGAELLKDEIGKAGRSLEVLAKLTLLLPDDSYLTEIELHQRKLTLTGRSASAARLISALAADGQFKKPAFGAPVTRLEGLRAEVFTIVAEMGPAL
jgi:general secretion pathway protein L